MEILENIFRSGRIDKPHRYKIESKSVVFVGVIGTDYEKLESISKGYENTTIIMMGDFGFGLNPENVEENILRDKIEFHLKKNSNYLVFLNGDRDNPSTMKGLKSRLINTRIFIPDNYEQFYINDLAYLCIGGATPFDLHNVVEDSTYFRNVALGRSKIVEDSLDIHTIFSHTSPNFCSPVDIEKLIHKSTPNSIELLEEINSEREQLAETIKNIKPKYLITSHFEDESLFEIKENIKCKHLSRNEEWVFSEDAWKHLEQINTPKDNHTKEIPSEPINNNKKNYKLKSDNSLICIDFEMECQNFSEVLEEALHLLGWSVSEDVSEEVLEDVSEDVLEEKPPEVNIVETITMETHNKESEERDDVIPPPSKSKRIPIVKFFKNNNVDPDFDEVFYKNFYSNHNLENFYQPRCKEKNISDRQRLFYHYKFVLKDETKHKNEEEFRKNRKETLLKNKKFKVYEMS